MNGLAVWMFSFSFDDCHILCLLKWMKHGNEVWCIQVLSMTKLFCMWCGELHQNSKVSFCSYLNLLGWICRLIDFPPWPLRNKFSCRNVSLGYIYTYFHSTWFLLLQKSLWCVMGGNIYPSVAFALPGPWNKKSSILRFTVCLLLWLQLL